MNKKNKIKRGIWIAIATIALVVVLGSLSWITMCGIIKLITLCFGLPFKWSIATGIWLILVVLCSIFKSNKK